MSKVNVCLLLNNLAALRVAARKKKLQRKKAQRRACSRKGCMTRPRIRKRVHQVFDELGRNMFRRAYRMHIETFAALYIKIKPSLFQAMSYSAKRTNAPNGRIHPTVFLACAIRVFAGGDPSDIGPVFGVSSTVVYDSVDLVISAVNNCDELAIRFPTNYAEQHKIAEGFRQKSKANIDACVGATDGMLVWILCVSQQECEKLQVGSNKFFCRRKKKFGLNMQATCDHERRFTDLSIKFPGATSDFLAFEASELRSNLEKEGFLAEGLCLFGDNAYVNKSYMATPFPNVADDRDNYNFFHSQLRINIECSFGMLVNRWGMLRQPMPQRYTIKKITSMVHCLCRLHNFLVDVNIQERDVNIQERDTPEPTASDVLNSCLNGGYETTQTTVDGVDGINHVSVPDEVLGGGHHHDDDAGQSMRRAIARRNVNNDLPRERIYRMIRARDLRRPSRMST